MQQDSKEMEIVDEVVEIERAAYQNYKAEVKTITLISKLQGRSEDYNTQACSCCLPK